MKTIKIGLALFTLFLVGCTTTPNQKEYGQFVHNETMTSKNISSYVQWNNEYAVTVKHSKVPFKVDYTSKDYDLRFVKLESLNVPVWGSSDVNENISMIGFPKHRQLTPTVAEGIEIGNVITLDGYKYRGVKTKIQQGMSGGPAFNSKNEAVGINIGFSTIIDEATKEKYYVSLYLPYEVIKIEWDKFNSLTSIQ